MEAWELTVREAIRDTIAQYSYSGDRLLLEDLAAAFAEDGVLEVKVEGGSEEFRGRNAIVERLSGETGTTNERIRAAAKKQNTSAGSLRIVRHTITNIRFESLTPEKVFVSCYFTVFSEIGLDHMGRYRDQFVPVKDRWLISHRFVSVDWYSERSTFRTP